VAPVTTPPPGPEPTPSPRSSARTLALRDAGQLATGTRYLVTIRDGSFSFRVPTGAWFDHGNGRWITNGVIGWPAWMTFASVEDVDVDPCDRTRRTTRRNPVDLLRTVAALPGVVVLKGTDQGHSRWTKSDPGRDLGANGRWVRSNRVLPRARAL
jgi:hypothetical protein